MRFPLLPRTILAPADSFRGAPAVAVAEVVRFRTGQDIDDADFLANARTTEGLVRAQPGFRARYLIRADDGVWTDFVIWESAACARAAAAAVMQAAEFAPFIAAIDVSSIEMSHQPVCWSMDG
jgi:hypothetical protein